jgi:hypothetical protein
MPTNDTSGGQRSSPPARVQSKAALLAAGLAYYGLYYSHLVRAYFQNVRLSQPGTFVSAMRMVWLILSVKDYTAVFVPRLAALHGLCKQIDESSVPGDVVECGVYNGGSAALIASLTCRQSRRAIWLFDSFEGLPQPTDKDGAKARSCVWWCHGDLSKVKEIFRKLRIPASQVHIVKGWFHDTLPSVDIQDIALLHVDADWYESVRLCLDTFYDRVRPGGFIVIDDYGHWEGCRRATDEFLARREIDVELTRVDYTGRYFQKPPAAQMTRVTARAG